MGPFRAPVGNGRNGFGSCRTPFLRPFWVMGRAALASVCFAALLGGVGGAGRIKCPALLALPIEPPPTAHAG